MKMNKNLFMILLLMGTNLLQAQELEWVKSMGGTSGDGGTSVAVDDEGNVYTIGWFRDTVDFDPGAGFTNLTSKGNTDIFIQKLDASGNLVWAKAIGGNSMDIGFSIALDHTGNLYTCLLYTSDAADD